MGFKEGEKLGAAGATLKEKGLTVPLHPELKQNKHGIDYEDKGRVRDRVKEELYKKYSSQLSDSFSNLKKHEFLVK